jgi:hypothetical protein
MRGWATHAATPVRMAERARRRRLASALPLAPGRLRVIVSLVRADIVVGAVKPIAVARDMFRVLHDAFVNLRHPLVQAPHTLQLFLEKRFVRVRHNQASPLSLDSTAANPMPAAE